MTTLAFWLLDLTGGIRQSTPSPTGHNGERPQDPPGGVVAPVPRSPILTSYLEMHMTEQDRPTLRQLLELYLDYRDQLGLLREGRDEFRSRYRRLMTRVGDQPPSALTRPMLKDWQDEIAPLVSARSAQKYTAAARQFCAWLVQTGRLETNPLAPQPSRAELLRAKRPVGPKKLATASTLDAVLTYVAGREKRGEITQSTARNHRTMLVHFADVVGNPDTGALSRRHVLKWLELPGSAGARRGRFSVTRSFARWLVDEGVLKADPFARIKAPREPRRTPRALAREDVLRTLDAAQGDRRLTLILLLMVQEGLRCVEVCNLQTGDVDFNERVMLVRGKGGHERVLPISDQTWEAMTAYLYETAAGAGPLIRSKVSAERGIKPRSLSAQISQFMANVGVKQASLDGRSAHAWRHTFATDALRNGAHLRDLQAALGHVSLQTTERYLSQEVRGLRAAMGGRDYRAEVS